MSSSILENAGLYSIIRRHSGAYLSKENSELCEKLTDAFVNVKRTSYGNNEERNAKLAMQISRNYLGGEKRVINGFQPFFEVPNSIFEDYLAKELVKGLKESRLVKNSSDLRRYTREFFSSLEFKAAEILGEEIDVFNSDPFDKVAGYHSEKEKVRDALVTQLLRREEMLNLGLEPSPGVILYGPPGTGKTSLAKAVCESAGINFFPYIGNDFRKKYVGEGAKKIKEVFENAKNHTPAVILIDEAEGCVPRRSSSSKTGDLTSSFLAYLDGFQKVDSVSLLLITNIIERFDDAVLSRISPRYRIEMPLPNEEYRKEIIDLKFSEMNHQINSFDWLIPITEGWSGRDIHNLVQESGWKAFKDNREIILEKDLEETINEFIKRDEKIETLSQ